jgi:hypothetical protein
VADELSASNRPATTVLQKPPARKRNGNLLAVAVGILVLIGVGSYALSNDGPSPGTVIGSLKLRNWSLARVKLVAGEVTFELAPDGEMTKNVHVGPSGRFKASLPPGHWYLTATANFGKDGEDGTSSAQIQRVVVASGHTSFVSLTLSVPS